MDAPVPKKVAPVLWRPEIRSSGTAEIGVNRWDEGPQRYTLDSVYPEEYLTLWTGQQLKFQAKYAGKLTEKPEHYPTPEQVAEYLEWRAKEAEKKTREFALAAKPVAKSLLVEQPPRPAAPPIQAVPAKEAAMSASKPAPAPPVVRAVSKPEFDLGASAQKICNLTKRDKEIVEALLSHHKPAGLTEASFKARISGICSELSIPTTNRFEVYDRREALKLVWGRYEAMLADGTIVPEVSLREQRLQMFHDTARALWDESGKRMRWLRPTTLLKRVAKDHPEGPKLATLKHFFSQELDGDEKASILQVYRLE